jgi:hypothetical protein
MKEMTEIPTNTPLKLASNGTADTVIPTNDATIITTKQPSISDAAQLKLQEIRVRRAEYNRRYRAKKKK